jgi:hypothetical protein
MGVGTLLRAGGRAAAAMPAPPAVITTTGFSMAASGWLSPAGTEIPCVIIDPGDGMVTSGVEWPKPPLPAVAVVVAKPCCCRVGSEDIVIFLFVSQPNRQDDLKNPLQQMAFCFKTAFLEQGRFVFRLIFYVVMLLFVGDHTRRLLGYYVFAAHESVAAELFGVWSFGLSQITAPPP